MPEHLKSFVNPYNFIPLGDGDRSKIDSSASSTGQSREIYAKEALESGYLDVKMYVKTPLIVPDGAHPSYYRIESNQEIKKIMNPSEDEKKNSHKKYSFYHVDLGNEKKAFMVPGSELRGMIRSVYEAVSDSCFPFLMNDKPISQRVPAYGSLHRRGLLEYDKKKNQWKLWSTVADKRPCIVTRDDKIEFEGREYHCGDQIKKTGEYVQCNVPVSHKEKYHIAFLEKDGDKPVHSWNVGDEAPYRELKSALKRDGVKGGQKNPNEGNRRSLLKYLEESKEKGGMVPVWFFLVTRGKEKLAYISNSSIGRIAQHRKWMDIAGAHKPCDDTENLCPACLLFGTIQGKGLKGKVRFTDAKCTKDNPELSSYLLDILGEPRTSAFEFYLEKPEEKATYWNFDFSGYQKKLANGRERIEYRDLPEAGLRGRKMYWHGKPTIASTYSKLNTTMDGLKEGTQLTFRIYFDQITRQQLQDLIWVVTLGENKAESTRQHKLGHAKPLGYGSVKLCVEQCHTRKLVYHAGELSVVMQHDFVKEENASSFDQKSERYKSLLAMCDTRKVEQNEVRYPRYVKESRKGADDSIYQWFANNRKNHKYLKTLPKPTDSDISMWGSWLDQQPGLRPEQKNRNDKTTKEPTEEKKSDPYIGTTRNVEVTYRKNKFVYFKLDGKDKGSVFCADPSINAGSKIRVKITKYDENYRSYGANVVK